jgi:O-antigen ligase
MERTNDPAHLVGLARLSDWLVRILALAGVAIICAYPARGWLTASDLPMWLRLCWPAAIAAALWAPRASLLAFVGGSPLLPILPSLARWPSVSLAEMWLFALLVAAGVRTTFGRRPWRVPLPAAVPILAAVATSSLFVTLYPLQFGQGGLAPLLSDLRTFARTEYIVAISQRHFYASVVAWAILIEGLALIWLVVSDLARDPVRGGRHVLLASAVGCALVSGYGVVQWWTRHALLRFWVVQDPFLTRINSTFSDVNALGAYLAMMIWVVCAIAYAAPARAWRRGWQAAALAAALAAVFTGSRAAWLAVVVGLGLYLAGLLRLGLVDVSSRLLERLRRVVTLGAVTLLIAVAGLTAYATAQNIRYQNQRSYADKLLFSLNLRLPIEERLMGRLPLWDAALRMVRRSPVFGIGIGRYYKEVWAYAARQEALIRPQENAHNYFLQLAAELGLAGLACFLALLWAGEAAAWTVAGGSASRETRLLALAVSVGIVAFAVTLLTGHSLLLREGQFSLWSLAGAALLLDRDCGEASKSRRPRLSNWLPTPARAALILGACALIVASVPFRAAAAADRVDVFRVPVGVYDVETWPDGQSFRWSTGHVTFYVPADAKVFSLPVRSLAPFPQNVSVSLDGVAVDDVRLADNGWRTLRYMLPARGQHPRYKRFELVVAPTWQPPNDGRQLGVMVGDYRWTR